MLYCNLCTVGHQQAWGINEVSMLCYVWQSGDVHPYCVVCGDVVSCVTEWDVHNVLCVEMSVLCYVWQSEDTYGVLCDTARVICVVIQWGSVVCCSTQLATTPEVSRWRRTSWRKHLWCAHHSSSPQSVGFAVFSAYFSVCSSAIVRDNVACTSHLSFVQSQMCFDISSWCCAS